MKMGSKKKLMFFSGFRPKQRIRSFSSCVDRAPLLSAWGSEYINHICPSVQNNIFEGYLHTLLHPSSSSMDSTSFALLLEYCSHEKYLIYGMLIHGHIIECNLGHVTFVINFLIQMYAKCESLQEAHACFVSISKEFSISFSRIDEPGNDAKHNLCFPSVKQLPKK